MGDGLKYQWYIKNVGDTTYSKSSNRKTSYLPVMSDASRDRMAYCVVTDQYGNSDKSNTVYLRMAASISSQRKNAVVAKDKIAKVTIRAKGDGLTYQWYVKNAGATKYSKSSVSSATYSVKMSSSSKDRRVYCVVTDKYGKTVKANTVILRMAATVTTQPKSVTVAKGETAKVSFKAVGDGLTYEWYYKDAGSSSFKKTTTFTGTFYSAQMTAARNGRQVYCKITDKYGKTVKTNTVTLKMK